MRDIPLRQIPGPNPGACPKCGRWRVAGLAHECSQLAPDAALTQVLKTVGLRAPGGGRP